VDNLGARAMLDAEDWQLAALVDQGLVRGVLDIRSATATRRELRFSVVAIEEYKRGLVTERTGADLAEILFGRPGSMVKARWVYRALNCKPCHFYLLATQRVIRLAKGSRQRVGPGGSAVVEWSELVNFINNRRIA
jgi:hypothetical protein